MLTHGAQVNAKDAYGATALDWTVRQNADRELIKLLLDYGADQNTAKSGLTCLIHDCPQKGTNII